MKLLMLGGRGSFLSFLWRDISGDFCDEISGKSWIDGRGSPGGSRGDC